MKLFFSFFSIKYFVLNLIPFLFLIKNQIKSHCIKFNVKPFNLPSLRCPQFCLPLVKLVDQPSMEICALENYCLHIHISQTKTKIQKIYIKSVDKQQHRIVDDSLKLRKTKTQSEAVYIIKCILLTLQTSALNFGCIWSIKNHLLILNISTTSVAFYINFDSH